MRQKARKARQEAYNLVLGTDVDPGTATLNVLRARAIFWQRDERLVGETEALMRENHTYNEKIFKGDLTGIPGID